MKIDYKRLNQKHWFEDADGTDECCAELYKALQTVFTLITRQQAELEDLREIVFMDRTEEIKKKNKELKSEAVKEFAEKLKEKSFETIRNYGLTKDVVEVSTINNLLKEMVSDDNA